MQFQGQGKPPLGVVFNTTMSRADSALALALLYGFEGKREARVAGIAVCGSGIASAAFCDVVGRFYAGSGPMANSNRVLPIGLAADGPLPPDPPMFKTALERRNEKGDPTYNRSVQKVTDTSEVPALLRNALTGQVDGNAVMLLSAPAQHMARMLDLFGTAALIKAKVRTLVISDAGVPQDAVAMRRLLSAWPTPIVLCGDEVGEALPFPASSIESDFAWSPAHPVVDAYRAYRPMPYDAPSWDMAATLYAVRPDAGLFQLSDPGSIQISHDGRMKIVPSAEGKHRSLAVDPVQKDRIIQIYKEIASAKPVPRTFGRPPRKDVEAVKTPPDKPSEAKPPAKP
jgi:purine nucleosidase